VQLYLKRPSASNNLTIDCTMSPNNKPLAVPPHFPTGETANRRWGGFTAQGNGMHTSSQEVQESLRQIMHDGILGLRLQPPPTLLEILNEAIAITSDFESDWPFHNRDEEDAGLDRSGPNQQSENPDGGSTKKQ
jgi:hypothetical protein